MNRRRLIGAFTATAIAPFVRVRAAVPIPEKVIKFYRGYRVEDDAMFQKIRSWVPEHHHEAFCGDLEKCLHARYGVSPDSPRIGNHYGTNRPRKKKPKA